MNLFGDLGELGPVDAKDFHAPPNNSEVPDKLAGYVIYRNFNERVVLTQTMRQGSDQLTLLECLLRIRNGTVTQLDWLDIDFKGVIKFRRVMVWLKGVTRRPFFQFHYLWH